MEENILVSNIIYISLIVLCLVLIIILFKQLRTTNKLFKTTQDKFHTKLSALENKYASTINTKPTTTTQTTIEETPITRHEKIVNSLPLYTQKLFTTTSAIIFTAMMLYIFYFVIISFQKSTYNALGIIYLDGNNKVNLWNFYVSNLNMLLIVLLSIITCIIFYIIGWLGSLTPQNISIKHRIFYNSLIAIVLCAALRFYFIDYELLTYLSSIIIFIILMLAFQVIDNKNVRIETKKEDKLLKFMAISFSTIYIIFYLFAGIISINGIAAEYYGKREGEKILSIVLKDEYLQTYHHIKLNNTKENIYLLDCEGAECTGLRKINDDKVALAFFERKDFTFYSETKEKTD